MFTNEATITQKFGDSYCLEYKESDGRNIVMISDDMRLLLAMVKGKVNKLIIKYEKNN